MEIEYLGNAIKLLGPYANKGLGGRLQVSFNDPVDQTKRRTQSMTRFCVQYALNSCVLPVWEVDHIDRNHQNNAIENLQFLERRYHALKDAQDARFIKAKCQNCHKIFLLLWRQYENNILKQAKSGPYCTKRCAGIASHSDQRSVGIYAYEESFLIKKPDRDEISGVKLIDYFTQDHVDRYNDLLIQLMRTYNARMLEQVYRSGSNPLARKSMRVRIPLRAPKQPQLSNLCENCKKEISSKARRCKSCNGFLRENKIDWPPTEELIEMVKSSSYRAVGRQLGVSDNAIRKRITRHS